MTTIRAHFSSAPDVPLVVPATVPTIRIRRTDTQALVVTDAAMTEQGEGNYTFEFEPIGGLEYAIRADGDPIAAAQTTVGGRFAHGSVSGDRAHGISQGWTRISAAGGTMRGIISLFIDGDTVALPGGSTLNISVQDSTGAVIFAQVGVTPNASGVFEVEETGVSLVAGTVLASFATITHAGTVYVRVAELAIPEVS